MAQRIFLLLSHWKHLFMLKFELKGKLIQSIYIHKIKVNLNIFKLLISHQSGNLEKSVRKSQGWKKYTYSIPTFSELGLQFIMHILHHITDSLLILPYSNAKHLTTLGWCLNLFAFIFFVSPLLWSSIFGPSQHHIMHRVMQCTHKQNSKRRATTD